MSQPTPAQLRAINKKARKYARSPRPQLEIPVPQLAARGFAGRGTHKLRGQSGLRPGAVILCAGLLIAGALLITQVSFNPLRLDIPTSVRMGETTIATNAPAWDLEDLAGLAGETGQEEPAFTLTTGRRVQITGVGLGSVRVSPVSGRNAGRSGWVPLATLELR